jgi:hypothetical protein
VAGDQGEAAEVRRSLFNGVQPAARNLLTDLQKAGMKAGIFFELCFIFANNPSILGFFAFQYDSDIETNTKMRV